MKKTFYLLLFTHLVLTGTYAQTGAYRDVAYLQDYSVKYYADDSLKPMLSIGFDRNGTLGVLAQDGLQRAHGGAFQYPGILRTDKSYKPMTAKQFVDMAMYQGQFVYLDQQEVFSNAFAGKWLVKHGFAAPKILCLGKDFTSVVSDGTDIKVFQLEKLVWEGKSEQGEITAIKYDPTLNRFIALSNGSLMSFTTTEKGLKTAFRAQGLTCLDIHEDKLFLGTTDGYQVLKAKDFSVLKPLYNQLPVSEITNIAFVQGHLWFGSDQGAFMLRADGKFNYYFGERWLPDNHVKGFAAGAGRDVYILTARGVGEMKFDLMTLEDKALVYEKQVRARHIRYGFNCDVVTLKHGDLSTSEMGQRDSDNLWTSMYLVSQLFRYKVTGSKEALANCMESFEAMERLFEITHMKGYFARGFERRGFHRFSDKPWDGGMHNGWVHAKDENWDWRGTTSSDQTVGQMFTLTLLAEHMEGDVKKRAIDLMDKLMTNIIDNDWYLIDFDGKPTLWAKWNPTYVNGFPKNVGDRKLNSSNIIGFLQTAYHFTGKKIYRDKAYELINKYGYMENLLRPMAEIGQDTTSGDWSKMLSQSWNHSDDEMYFLAYWCLYPYAFDPKLKEQYRVAIKQHWELERPERDGLWNLCYKMTGASAFDQNETVWYLKEFPLDMIEWKVANSHRKDIKLVPDNFRGQTTAEVLPPDERPELKHNRNLFKLDRETNGAAELSAGDSFLLPYWMGRFLGAISAPVK